MMIADWPELERMFRGSRLRLHGACMRHDGDSIEFASAQRGRQIIWQDGCLRRCVLPLADASQCGTVRRPD